MMANKAHCDNPTSPVDVAVAAAVELPASPQMNKATVMKTPFHTKTASMSTMPAELKATSETDEPADSNAAEPIWYVTPPAPAPLHHNPSMRRSSVTPITIMPPDGPGFMSPTFLNDITLDLDSAMFESPKTMGRTSILSTPPSSSADATGVAATASALSEALYTPMDTTHMTTIWPSNATTEIQFSLESPTLEIEMEQFGHPPAQKQQQVSSTPSFFTGFFAIPPSLAGRPQLTEQQQDYVRREYERGPVPLMWPKEDLENQQTDASQAKNASGASGAAGGGWFSSWWAGKPAETRREGAMAQ